MDKSELVEKLTITFRTVFKLDSLVLYPELTANDVEAWDSLSHMLLITEIENAFSIKFKLKDLNKMQNIGNMIEIINSKFQ